jgi:hypothetical protein
VSAANIVVMRTPANKKRNEEMIMKYFAAICLLAAPLAMSVAPTAAEAGYNNGHRDGYRCHFVKKAVWRHGRKRAKLVKVCKKRPTFARRNARKHSQHRKHNRRWR